MKPRLTVLLGAGAMIEDTGISTEMLTKIIIDKTKSSKLMKDIINNLENQTKSFSFEDIFHCLEILNGFKNSKYSLIADLKIDNKGSYSLLDEIIGIINDKISEYDSPSNFQKTGESFKTFFKQLAENFYLDIFNLNYDTWIEQSLDSYVDGFIDIPKYNFQRFDINKFLNTQNDNIVAHLHGQIKFALPNWNVINDKSNNRLFSPDDDKYVYIYPRNTLYKYQDYDDANRRRKNIIFHSPEANQSGENIFNANIVTGLLKSDKILQTPFDIYYHKFLDSLIKNNNLLIIGYGFSDLHINKALYKYNTVHQNDKKVVLIDYFKEDDISKLPFNDAPYTLSNKSDFINKITHENCWGINYKKYIEEYLNKKSLTNSIIIFNNGFHDARIPKNLKTILDFYRNNKYRKI